MFARSVVESDAFLDLSIEARVAYFYLGMHTDDDGFVGNPKTVCRVAGVSFDAVGELAENGFVTLFDSGVAYDSHFSTNNSIRKDRYTPTEYQDEKTALEQGADIWQPSDNQMATDGQPNISKERGVEGSSGEISLSQAKPSQIKKSQANAGAPSAPNPAHAREEPPEFDRPPTLEEVEAYAATLPEPRPSPRVFMNAMQIRGWLGVTDWRDELANREW